MQATAPSPSAARATRRVLFQAVLLLAVAALFYAAFVNVTDNLRRAHIASGFGFWSTTAGFDISQTLIPYSSSTSTFGRTFWVGLLNTLLVGAIGIVLATALGFTIGIAQLSRNWLIARLANGYVGLIRNIPLLLQLLFWYNAVLKTLPDLRSSIVLRGFTLPGHANTLRDYAILNNRGLFLPAPQFAPGFGVVLVALLAGIAGAVAVGFWARRRQEQTGGHHAIIWPVIGLVMGLPVAAFILAGAPLSFTYPEMGRFNVTGGVEIIPEFAALVLALSIYTAAFIAETVRAGILAVSPGQTEAALALGLRPGPTRRLIVIPQAMRVIVPPLTSQYLNLVKNSSLAVAIGYPDLVQVFAGSVLNITGQAVEIIALTMAVYLCISLLTSLVMNLYGRRIALVER